MTSCRPRGAALSSCAPMRPGKEGSCAAGAGTPARLVLAAGVCMWCRGGLIAPGIVVFRDLGLCRAQHLCPCSCASQVVASDSMRSKLQLLQRGLAAAGQLPVVASPPPLRRSSSSSSTTSTSSSSSGGGGSALGGSGAADEGVRVVGSWREFWLSEEWGRMVQIHSSLTDRGFATLGTQVGAWLSSVCACAEGSGHAPLAALAGQTLGTGRGWRPWSRALGRSERNTLGGAAGRPLAGERPRAIRAPAARAAAPVPGNHARHPAAPPNRETPPPLPTRAGGGGGAVGTGDQLAAAGAGRHHRRVAWGQQQHDRLPDR